MCISACHWTGYIHIHTYTNIYTHIHTYTYIYIHIHTYTYIYIYTCLIYAFKCIPVYQISISLIDDFIPPICDASMKIHLSWAVAMFYPLQIHPWRNPVLNQATFHGMTLQVLSTAQLVAIGSCKPFSFISRLSTGSSPFPDRQRVPDPGPRLGLLRSPKEVAVLLGSASRHEKKP